MWLSHDGWIQTEEHLPCLQVHLHEPTQHLVGSLKFCFRIWLSWDKNVQVWSAPFVTIRATQIKSPHMPGDLDLPDNSTFMYICSFSANTGGCGQPSPHGNPKSLLLINRQRSSLGPFLPNFTVSPGGCTGVNWLGMKNQSPSDLGLQRRKVRHSYKPYQRTVKLFSKDWRQEIS